MGNYTKYETPKSNARIREALKEKGLYQWQLADLLGKSEMWLTRKMRHEMDEDEQNRIIDIIQGVL